MHSRGLSISWLSSSGFLSRVVNVFFRRFGGTYAYIFRWMLKLLGRKERVTYMDKLQEV